MAMRGGEKPFEMLSSKEREAFELCSEILNWSSYPDRVVYPGVIQLREDATRLYELIAGMDMEHDDRYYKVYAELDLLTKRYEELRKTMRDEQRISKVFNPEKDQVEELLDLVRRYIHSKSSAHFTLHHNNHFVGYGDWINISISKNEASTLESNKVTADTYSVRIEEIFDYVQYRSPYAEALYEALEQRFEKKIAEMATTGTHLHDFGGVQYSTIFKDMSPEEVDAVAAEVLQIIKNYPRQPKLKKGS